MKITPIKLRELDYLTICNQRGLLTEQKQKKRLTRLEAGDNGELDLVDFLLERLPTHWHLLRNVWLEFDGNITEVDILIITPKLWWILEVKNYRGQFDYHNHTCYLNQSPFPDQIAACRNRLRIVNCIANQMKSHISEVHCSMVFINELCQVTAETQPDIELVMRYQLPWHLNEMIQRHKKENHTINQQESLNTIHQYEVEHPYLPQAPNPTALALATKGISCRNCHSYNVQIYHRQTKCHHCHDTISKTQAVLQSVCELGILYYNNPKIITTANLYEFTSGKISQKGIRLILKKHLHKYGIKHGTYYENYALPYEQMKDRFKQE